MCSQQPITFLIIKKIKKINGPVKFGLARVEKVIIFPLAIAKDLFCFALKNGQPTIFGKKMIMILEW